MALVTNHNLNAWQEDKETIEYIIFASFLFLITDKLQVYN